MQHFHFPTLSHHLYSFQPGHNYWDNSPILASLSKILILLIIEIYTMRPTVCWRPTECWFLNFSLLKKISRSNHDDFHSILFSDNVRTDINGACWVTMNFFYIFLFHNSKMHWFWNANFGKCDPILSVVGNKSAKGGF